MLIRPFRPADAQALAALFHASVREAGCRDYSAAQVAAWSPVAIERAAKRDGIARLFVEASEAARRLFERRGFSVEARNDVALHGVMLHNYRMSKALD